MKTRTILHQMTLVLVASALTFFSGCSAPESTSSQQEVRVITSGGFTAAYKILVPQFERETKIKVLTAYGPSMGDAPEAIPNRLARGEPADVVILASESLKKLIQDGKVVPGSEVDLGRSRIGMVVKAGKPKPDISSVEALKQTLLEARSIAYSGSASGVYLSTVLFPRLGIAEMIKHKCKQIKVERVGAVVARGEAEIGFQQISELLPISGVDFVGPLPQKAQKETFFSAGIVVGAKESKLAKEMLRFFSSSAAAPIIKETGLEPVTQ